MKSIPVTRKSAFNCQSRVGTIGRKCFLYLNKKRFCLHSLGRPKRSQMPLHIHFRNYVIISPFFLDKLQKRCVRRAFAGMVFPPSQYCSIWSTAASSTEIICWPQTAHLSFL